MNWIPDRYRKLRLQLGLESIEDEVGEELRLHVELRAADLEAMGLSPDEARAEAQRRFGDMAAFGAQTYAIEHAYRREQRHMEIMDTLRRESRQALRSMSRAPFFTTVAVLTLALGIGATTAIFTLLHAAVLRPLPYPEPDRPVEIRHAVPGVSPDARWGNSVASYFFYSDNNEAFESLGAYGTTTISLSGDGEAERVDAASVAPSTLTILGIQAIRGRLFIEEEALPDGERVALISHELWQSRYNSDPGILGRTILVNASPVTVVGVVAAGTRLPQAPVQVWLPFRLDRTAQAVNAHFVSTYGRMRPGMTPEAARRDLQRLADRMPDEFPTAYSHAWFESSGFTPDVTPLRVQVTGRMDRVLWIVFGAVSLVLLIAAANVANLYLVRAETRRREQSVRAAMGAGRAHFAVQYVTESLLLGMIAACAGVLLAWMGVRLLIFLSPPGIPRLHEVSLGLAGIAFAAGTALVVAVVFGLVPALRGRTHFGDLREGGRGLTASRERHYARNTLVVGQVGLALMLLTAGGLMLQSFINLRNVESGIDTDGVLTFGAFPPGARYPTRDAQLRFRRELVERIGALPGVTHVSATQVLPFANASGCSYTTIEGKVYSSADLPPCMPHSTVLPDYFETMGIKVSGETFSWGDVDRRTSGAVVSRAFAHRMWPGEDPIGKGVVSQRDGPPWFRVVGIAEDVRADGLDRPAVEEIYYPPHTIEDGASVIGYTLPNGFVVRAGVPDLAGLPEAIRRVAYDLDPDVPLANIRTMNDVVRSSEAVARGSFTLVLLGISSIMALFLSAVGLYGVIAYLVGARRSEIGVRMALGARVIEVGRMVLMQSLRLTAFGIVLGIAGSLLTGRVLSSLLFEVQSGNPRVLALVTVLLLLVAAAASVIPARRAARIDPSEALRSE